MTTSEPCAQDGRVAHQPVTEEPRRLRPDGPDPRRPYCPADPALGQQLPVWGGTGESVDAWRARVHAAYLAAMLEPLTGIEVTAYERRHLEWLAGWELGTVAVVASLLDRARRHVDDPTTDS